MPEAADGPADLARLRVGVYGDGRAARRRRESLARVGVAVAWEGEDEAAADGETVPALPPLDVLVVGGPVAARASVAAAAAARGIAPFVEWPPAPGLREATALVRLGEETGVDVGIARTVRFSPSLAALDALAPAPLVLVDATANAPLLADHVLADLVDLALRLTRGTALRRLDARLVRDAARAPVALAASLRVAGGALAQIALTPSEPAAAPRRRVTVAGPAGAAEADLAPERDAVLDAETRAVLAAAARGAAPPVTALDALALVRTVERVLSRLR